MSKESIFLEAQQYAEFVMKSVTDSLLPDEWNKGETTAWRKFDHPKTPEWKEYTAYPEIKNCPFCGSKGEMVDFGSTCCGHGDYYSEIGIECAVCNATKGVCDRDMQLDFRAMTKAIEIWNTRA